MSADLEQARAMMDTIADGNLLEFTYTNWRGDDDVYLVAPRGVEFGRFNGADSDRWYLHAQTVTRDGQPRAGAGSRLRRSFEIAGIRNCWTTPRGGEDGC